MQMGEQRKIYFRENDLKAKILCFFRNFTKTNIINPHIIPINTGKKKIKKLFSTTFLTPGFYEIKDPGHRSYSRDKHTRKDCS